MTTVSRFSNLSFQEKRTKIQEKDSKNTRKANDRAVKLFHTYVIEKGEDKKIESITKEELNKYLLDFYIEVRKETGNFINVTRLILYVMVCRELSRYALAKKHGTQYEHRPFIRQIFLSKQQRKNSEEWGKVTLNIIQQ